MNHVEREYIFEGCQIPVKFMDALYTRDSYSRSLRFVGTDQADYGDSITVKVSAANVEILDYGLEEWSGEITKDKIWTDKGVMEIKYDRGL